MACTSLRDRHCNIGVFPPSQLTPQHAKHLAALTGLTSLVYRDEGMEKNALGAISQLTRLQSLQLEAPATNVQLERLSTLACLTSLQITGE